MPLWRLRTCCPHESRHGSAARALRERARQRKEEAQVAVSRTARGSGVAGGGASHAVGRRTAGAADGAGHATCRRLGHVSRRRRFVGPTETSFFLYVDG